MQVKRVAMGKYLFKIGLDLEGQFLINLLKIQKSKLRPLQILASVSSFEERILLVLNSASFLHVVGSMGSTSVNMMILCPAVLATLFQGV